MERLARLDGARLDGVIRDVTLRAKARLLGIALSGAAALLPVAAQANSAAVDYFRNRANRTAVPSLLTQE